MKHVEDDAWKQHDDLIEQFTREWEPRPDLRVCAFAWDRSVQLGFVEKRPNSEPSLWHDGTGKRNVNTMRELAEAILAACDFVEACNPKWAGRASA